MIGMEGKANGDKQHNFWIRRLAALGGEAATVEYWQLKRDGTKRGIVEVTQND
jgi:hypothetical protein